MGPDIIIPKDLRLAPIDPRLPAIFCPLKFPEHLKIVFPTAEHHRGVVWDILYSNYLYGNGHWALTIMLSIKDTLK